MSVGRDAKGRRVWTDDERKVLRSLTKQARVYRSTDATDVVGEL